MMIESLKSTIAELSVKIAEQAGWLTMVDEEIVQDYLRYVKTKNERNRQLKQLRQFIATNNQNWLKA